MALMTALRSLRLLLRVRPSGLASAPRLRLLSVRGRPGESTLRVAVDGLVCGACAARTASALRAVPGVRAARVDLDTGVAEVVTSRDVSEYELRHAVAGVVIAPRARLLIERLVMWWRARGPRPRREGHA